MIKRIFDLFFSISGVIILIPIFLIVSILIKLDSNGPVLFLQNRVGQYANIFQIIKFRTMNVNQNSNLTISIAGDKRITRIGKILRKYKIDELPELINILRGEMSFVGPRPDVAGYADKLLGDDRKILQLRPGITSSASLKYSNEEHLLSIQKNPKSFNDNIIFPDKVRMNLKYYKNHNIWLDIKIIFATVFRLNY
jgi:lipopolysaccharide/colanic/teichoic acid biosynthesis glycosyltransferase